MSKEQSNKPGKSNKHEAVYALADIRERYPRIRTADIERFAPVYYPVAMVEMLLEEQTFEDFETVHLAVLRLISLGIRDYKLIAQTLSLSASYVFKVMHLLTGYGHISDAGLTDLGRESLQQQKKIITTDTLQKFQVDALNGRLLKTQQAVAGNMLNSKDETITMIGHLNYLDGMDAQTLSAQLTGGNCENYLNQKSGVLHTNVRRIKAARCTEIKYAKCYLLKLRGCINPIIFAKRYNRMAQDLKQRFPWQPFSAQDLATARRYGLDADTPVNTPLATEYVHQLYQMLKNQSSGPKFNLEEQVAKALAHSTPFQADLLDIRLGMDHTTGLERTTVYVPEKAVVKFSGELVNLLAGISRDDEYLITDQWLYGHIVSVRVRDARLRILAGLLSDKIAACGQKEVSRHLRSRFRDQDNDPKLTEKMIACVQEIKASAE